MASEDTALGDLSEDVMGDKNFPYNKTEKEILSYLDFQTGRHGNSEIFKELVEAYELQKDTPVDPMNLDVNYTPLKAEKWIFLKANFPSDRAITVGEKGDIYRVYGVDSASEKALKFDVYTKSRLTELSIVDLENIVLSSLTKEVSIQEALDSLEANLFEGTREPAQPNYAEMIDYLKSQLK